MIIRFLNWIKQLFTKDGEKKYSLENYLDIVSRYTDNVISTENKNKNYFTGGDCTAECMDDSRVRFYIRMYFIDVNKERTIKESERILKISNFDENTKKLLKEGSKSFEIIKPRAEV